MSTELDIRQRALKKLRCHAHQILAGGYDRLRPADFAETKEPDITGELCKAMSEFMAADDAPGWVTQYALRDDPKLNLPGLHGESRRRIDIEVERVQRGSRPMFRFEAKRLGPDHPLSGYLGSEGMGAFVSGYYPLTHPEAGMLGYFQQHDLAYWYRKLESELRSGAVSVAEGLTPQSLANGLPTWRSVHSSSTHLLLTIWHTLLRFW